MEKYSFNAHLELDIDPELCYSDEYFDRYKFLQGNFNQVLHIVEKRSGKPVTWHQGIKFNQENHSLTTYFKKEIIELFPHNEQYTLAYCPDGVATIKIYLLKKYNWKTHIEKRFLAIVSNLIFNIVRTPKSQILRNRGRYSEILTKNEVYNILLILNSKLTTPLDDELINKLTTYIWLKNLNDELHPPIEIKKSIRSQKFMNVFLDNYPECDDYSIQQAVKAELNRVKGVYINDKYADTITKYVTKYPNSRYTDRVKNLMKKHSLKKSNASRIYCKWKKVSSPTPINNISNNNGDKVSNDTLSIIKMKQFIQSYRSDVKLTQKVVSVGSGVSIAQVKRKWFLFKEQVDKIKKKKR